MKVDGFLEELILYLYYFKGYSVRDIASELRVRSNIKLSHTAVHKLIQRAQNLDPSPELLEWIRSIEQRSRSRILEYDSAKMFADNESFRAATFTQEEIQQKLNINGRIYSVLFDDKTKNVTFIYEADATNDGGGSCEQ